MSSQVTTAFKLEFTTKLELLLQQFPSVFRGLMSEDSYSGDKAVVVEQMGKVALQRKTEQFADAPLISVPHERRWMAPVVDSGSDSIDTEDKLRTLVSLKTGYMMSFVAAANRAHDIHTVKAFFGDALTGENGTTLTPFPASQEIDKDIGGVATGLNLDKLKAGFKKALAAHLDLPNDKLYMAISAEQNNDLLEEIRITSGDFNSAEPVLVNGFVKHFMGINFVHSEELLTKTEDSKTVRRCPLWSFSGMHFGPWIDIRGRVINRESKTMNPEQVIVETMYGATRLEEKKVIEIECVEA